MRRLIYLIIGLVVIGIVTPIALVQFGYRSDIVQTTEASPTPVALVLGASIYAGKPSAILEDRLLTALDLYTSGKVKKLILSGDNRSVDYNEPTAMKNYLVEHGVPETDLVLDYAGRRTYDSCYRLKEIFDQKEALIVTQQFHLPRALYLCNNIGVGSHGIAADRAIYGDALKNTGRELLASWQAWWDITFRHPTPILGDKVQVF